MDILPKHLQEECSFERNTTAWTTDLYARPQWEFTIFADDVKIQANNATTLQIFLDSAATWAKKYGMTWSTNKCKIPQKAEHTHSIPPTLAGNQLDNVTATTYLAVTITAKEVAPDPHIRRSRNTIIPTH